MNIRKSTIEEDSHPLASVINILKSLGDSHDDLTNAAEVESEREDSDYEWLVHILLKHFQADCS